VPLIEGVRDWFFSAVPGEFAFAQCRQCQSLLLQDRPVAAHIGKAYSGYYTHSGEAEVGGRAGAIQRIGQTLANGYVRRRFGRSTSWLDKAEAALFACFPVRRAEVDAVHRYLPRAASDVLDYGCGNGDFLARSAQFEHRVVGVDFDPQAVGFARRRGLTVFEPGEASAAEFAQKFDHITAAHVLEHVTDPPALLRDFHRWLRPGGHLYLEFPNAEAAGLGAHGRFWRGLEAPRHFSLPSENGLRRALGETGFAPVIIGQRAFARQFMDSASRAAAQANGGGEVGLPGFSGPEMLTCLARAV